MVAPLLKSCATVFNSGKKTKQTTTWSLYLAKHLCTNWFISEKNSWWALITVVLTKSINNLIPVFLAMHFRFTQLSWFGLRCCYYIFRVPTFMPQHCVPIGIYAGPCFRECCLSSSRDLYTGIFWNTWGNSANLWCQIGTGVAERCVALSVRQTISSIVWFAFWESKVSIYSIQRKHFFAHLNLTWKHLLLFRPGRKIPKLF